MTADDQKRISGEAAAELLVSDMNVLTVSGLGGVSLLMLSRTKAAS